MKKSIYRVIHYFKVEKGPHKGKEYRLKWDIYAADNQEAQFWSAAQKEREENMDMHPISVLILNPKQTRNARNIERLRAERFVNSLKAG